MILPLLIYIDSVIALLSVLVGCGVLLEWFKDTHELQRAFCVVAYAVFPLVLIAAMFS